MHVLLALQDHVVEHADAAHGGQFAAGPMAFEWVSFVASIAVFLIALGILWVMVWPKITKGLDDRDQKILNEIKAAEEAREQAKAALAKYESELANARDEASKMIQKARSDAKAAAEELRARNESELTELRARARREIDAAKAAAIGEIHAEAANLATAVAARILKREINVHDQQGFVTAAIAQLAGIRG